MAASALIPAIVNRREPQKDTLNSVRVIAEDIEREPVSVAPHKAPEPIQRPTPVRAATTWIKAFVGGMPRWEEDRFLGRPFQPLEGSRIPRGAMSEFDDPANIYLPPSTAYGNTVEIG